MWAKYHTSYPYKLYYMVILLWWLGIHSWNYFMDHELLASIYSSVRTFSEWIVESVVFSRSRTQWWKSVTKPSYNQNTFKDLKFTFFIQVAGFYTEQQSKGLRFSQLVLNWLVSLKHKTNYINTDLCTCLTCSAYISIKWQFTFRVVDSEYHQWFKMWKCCSV